jgi:hypothetical protein
MALPWIRLDANIATHDKIVHLMLDPSAKKYQAGGAVHVLPRMVRRPGHRR